VPLSTQSQTPALQQRIVEPGQLVYVQLLQRMTIEGFSSQADDPSYWHNPDLSARHWPAGVRPAVVLKTSSDAEGCHTIKVVAIGRRHSPVPAAVGSPVRITDKTAPAQNDTITVVPDWPLEDMYCYAFPRSATFVLDPQVKLTLLRSIPC
jgi:hypothetical protein